MEDDKNSQLLAKLKTIINDKPIAEKCHFHKSVMNETLAELSNLRKKLINLVDEAEETKVRFKTLHNASFGGIAIHDKGFILDCNQGLSEITGYSVYELIGMDGLLLIADHKRELVMENIQNGYEKPYEAVGLKKDGQEYPLQLEARNIEYKNKKYRAVEFRDITKQKEAENEIIKAKNKAEESDKLKTAFLNNISHEFRTPMNGILGFSELLLKANKSDEQRKLYAEIIRESCDNLLNVVTDTIEISEIQTNTISVKYETFDIGTQIEEVIQLLKLKAKKKGNRFEFNQKCNEKSLHVKSDKNKIFRVLKHIVDNAIKFTDNGIIEISCCFNNGNICIAIKDTGIGISEEAQKTIFKVYRQNETGLTRNYNGNGLGLTLVKSYIELLGGQIKLQSEINKGTCITISLPIDNVSKIEVISNNNELENSDLSNKTILIAEDEEMNYMYLEELLSETNAKILYASNGQKAVDLCREGAKIDLILMDIKMPVMDGHQATKLIKQFRSDIPIIAQTAFAMESDKIKFLENGFDAHLSKPISEEKLFETVHKLKFLTCVFGTDN